MSDTETFFVAAMTVVSTMVVGLVYGGAAEKLVRVAESLLSLSFLN